MEQDYEPVIRDILNHYGLTDRGLNNKVGNVQQLRCEWRRLPVYLGMGREIVDHIDMTTQLLSESRKREKFFEQWKTLKAKDATYRALVIALLKCNNKEDAEDICKLSAESPPERVPRSDVAAQRTETDSDATPSKQPKLETEEQKESKRQELGEDILPLDCFNWDVESEDTLTAGALVPASDKFLWPPKEKLKVYFLNTAKGIEYDGDSINNEQIIGWMNSWSPIETSSVPKFERTKECDGSDIRVKFTDKSYTLIGTKAREAEKNKPTMLLYLGKKGDSLIKYTVLHETGHALGFFHEHQHLNLGKCVFNEDNVIEDLRKIPKIEDPEKFYDTNFGGKVIQAWRSGDQTYPFDSNSVMKYKMKRSWVNKRSHKDFFAGNYEDGDYSWPDSARTGELTDSDIKNAERAYSKELPLAIDGND